MLFRSVSQSRYFLHRGEEQFVDEIPNHHGEEEMGGWEDPEQHDDEIEKPEALIEQAAAQENKDEEFHSDGEGEMMDAMKDEMADPQMSLKDRLASVLEGYINEKEQLESLQQDNPELYQEVLLLLQQMISVARKLNSQGTPPPMENQMGDKDSSNEEAPQQEEQSPMGKPVP